MKVNKYHRQLEGYEKRIAYREYLLFKQIEEWEKELKELIAEDRDYRRQLELIQVITQEKVFYDERYEKKIFICMFK